MAAVALRQRDLSTEMPFRDRDKASFAGYKEPTGFAGCIQEFVMRVIGVVILTASLFASAATAEPLAAGHPAGVRAARGGGMNTAWMLGIGAAILGGVGILASGSSSAVSSLIINVQPVTAPPVVTTGTGTAS